METEKTKPGFFGIVATLWFWLVFAVTAPVGLFLGVGSFLVGLPFDPERNWVHAFLTRWTFDYLKINPFWSVTVEHRERIPQTPCVFIANHRSMADVVAAMGLRTRFKFVSKASLFNLPAVGWMMKLAHYVSLDRGNLASTRGMWAHCRGIIMRGGSILLFPEGTYGTGEKLLPFRRGAFSLALECNVPVVPVALVGTTTLVHGDGPWMNARAKIAVRILEPIQPAAFEGNVQAFSDAARAALEDALRVGYAATP